MGTIVTLMIWALVDIGIPALCGILSTIVGILIGIAGGLLHLVGDAINKIFQ